jgi:hypothetical protein
MKPLARYDKVFALCVDYRYDRESHRISDLLESQGVDEFQFYIDGEGHQLPRRMYTRISPATAPRTWQDGLPAYRHFTAVRDIIRQGKEKGWKTILLVEDDLVLLDNFEEVAGKALEQLPDDWDMFYFGANHSGHRTKQIAPNLLRCFGSACTHCVAFKDSIYDAILELPEDRTIDWNIGYRLHELFRCYAAWPNTAIQKPGYSTLWLRSVDYTPLWDNKGGKYETRIPVILPGP